MLAPSNQIKVAFIIILPFNIVNLWVFFLFHIEIEGKGGWIIGGGAKGYVAPLSNYWGGGLPPPPLPPPLPTPMGGRAEKKHTQNNAKVAYHILNTCKLFVKLKEESQ